MFNIVFSGKSKVEKDPPDSKTNTSTEKGGDFLDELFDPETSSLKASKLETKSKPDNSVTASDMMDKSKDEQSISATVEVPTEPKKEGGNYKTKDTPSRLSSSVSSSSTNKPRSLPSWLSGISCDSVSKSLKEVKRKAPPPSGTKATKKKSTKTDNTLPSPPPKVELYIVCVCVY